jgi:DNA-binding NarL/FixJ family response regulator
LRVILFFHLLESRPLATNATRYPDNADRPSHLAPRMGRSSANRSLERGMDVLRAFRPGLETLGNGEIAERTGLSPSTVSRLTQTLVDSG